MSLLSNTAQIKLTQANRSANTQNAPQTQNGSNLTGSSFFDILRTVADSKSSLKFTSPAKLSNNTSRSVNSASVGKNTAKSIGESDNANTVTDTSAKGRANTENTAVTDDAISANEQRSPATESAQSKRSKSVDAIVVDKSISEESGVGIEINITELLQLLGISPAMAQKLLGDYLTHKQQGGDILSAITSSISNTGVSLSYDEYDAYGSGEDVFVDLDSVLQILNGVAQSDFDGFNLTKGAFENASDLAVKLESIVNGKNAAEINIDAVKDAVIGYVKEKVVQEIQMRPTHNLSNIPDLRDVTDVGGGRDYLFKFLEDNNINIDDIGIQEIKFFTTEQQDNRQNVFDAVNLMRNGVLKTAQIQTAEATVSSVKYLNEKAAATAGEDNTLAAIRLRHLSQPRQALQNISQVQANNINNTNSNQTMNLGLRQETLTADNGMNMSTNANTLTANQAANNTAETPRIEIIDGSTAKINDALLTGIVDARNPVMINNTTEKLVELKTHISNVANELTNMIVKNKNESGFSVKMRLAPEGLGEVLLKITYNKGNVNLNVITENKAAEVQLISQVENLKESLASHNFSLSGFDVETRDSGHGYNQQDNRGGNHQSRYYQSNENADSSDNTAVGEIQKLSSFYMNRLVYRTV